MDFVSLADTERAAKNLVLRYLMGETGEGTENNNNNNKEDWMNDDEILYEIESSPVFSKTSEAELYLLATNFLLYVALVIIIVIIAKVYFPESLERGTDVAKVSRSFSYRVAATAQQNDNYYSSECDDDDNDYDDENILDSEAESSTNSDDIDNENDKDNKTQKNILEDDGLFHDDSDDDDNEQEKLLPEEQREQPKKQGRRISRLKRNFLEFEQEKLPRKEVMKRLALCCLMLNITFITWGVLQERMLTRRYPRGVGEYFIYSYALVFTNRFWTLLFSIILLVYLKPSPSQTTVIYEYSFPSISNMLSSWCQYEALRYVSFPALTLFKAFKLAPVMAMGKILGNKSYPQYDYVVALFIGIGIAMFMSSTDDLSFGLDYLGQKNTNVSSTWTGVMLLVFFLFFDSFTSQFQSRMFQRHRDLSMIEVMFATSSYSTVLSLVTLIHTKELYPAITFVLNHSEIHLHFFMFSICSTIGQLFIIYTIKNFGAVVFTLIMTTRILLSITLSCILYDHHISGVGFLGLMLVLISVLYRIRKKTQGKQLVKWQGMVDDDKSKQKELVEEWHEHIDM